MRQPPKKKTRKRREKGEKPRKETSRRSTDKMSTALYKGTPGADGESYDQISVTTVTANSNMHLNAEQENFYNTYDLSYTPENYLSITSCQYQIITMIAIFVIIIQIVKLKLPEVKVDEPEIFKKMLEFSTALMTLMDRIDKKLDHFGCSSLSDRLSILVFLPEIREIEELYGIQDASVNEFHNSNIILNSSMTNKEQGRIFKTPPQSYRNIILSTTIAESSLTVPNVKYIIDFCLTKQLVINPSPNVHSFELTWASHANCQQRAGRTGRVYYLVPRLFNQQVLSDEDPAEMVRAPFENVYRRVKVLSMEEPKALLALPLDPPALSNITRTILNLREAGALGEHVDDPHDGELTGMGKIMAQLLLRIQLSKSIMLEHVSSVRREAIITGARQWFEGTKRVFEELITGLGNQLYGWAYSVANSVVTIFRHVYNDNSEKIQMNDFSVREGGVQCREKNYLYKINHGIRKNINKLSVYEKTTHTELQHRKLYLSDSYVNSLDEEDCPITLTLKEPNFPREVNLSSLIETAVGLSVNIDQVSVNSIQLDTTRSDPPLRYKKSVRRCLFPEHD